MTASVEPQILSTAQVEGFVECRCWTDGTATMTVDNMSEADVRNLIAALEDYIETGAAEEATTVH